LPERFGRYRVLKQLGQGGMGAVYLAHDTQLDRPVALKVPHFAAEDGPDVLERFHREARAAATLSHPNLCPVYDVGEWNGTHFLTMAYIEGKPLSDYIRSGKQIPERHVAALIRKLALALQEAHARGVVHRDLKPSNIMFNQRKEPVIMDFGLARRIDKGDARLTKSGSVLGTPAYMPPEQVAGHTDVMGPACDIYSLGVIMYEMLIGRLPFEGPAIPVLALILTKEPEKPSAHRPELDPQLEAICLKAMAKKMEERYTTMAELAQALADRMRTLGPAADKAPRKDPRASAASTSQASVFANLEPEPHASAAQAPSLRWRGRWILLAAAGAAAAILLAGVIIITQRKDRTATRITTQDETRTEDQVPAAVPSAERDHYENGVSLKWEPLRDSQGKPISGGGPCLSSDDLQLVLRRSDRGGPDRTGLFIARRKSLSSPFGSPERLAKTSTKGGDVAPCFTNEDRVLYFRPCEAGTNTPGRTIMRATRPHRDADFGRGEPAPGIPAHVGGGHRFSPDGNISFLFHLAFDASPCIVHRRSEKEAFQMEEADLPRWEPGHCSAIHPTAIANDGSIVFTQEVDGAIWLCGAKRIDHGTFGSIARYLILPDLSRGLGTVPATLTHKGRLVISQLNGELIVMRVPEPAAAKITELLGY
jgi:serine/threonine protein kinase